jgi:hypothetical protein
MYRYALSVVLPLGALALPGHARADEAILCAGDRVVPGWILPPRRDVIEEDAVRWPLDATLRFTFFGPLCPAADLVDLRDADGAPIAASVRVHVPAVLGEIPEMGNTLVEVDPVEPLDSTKEYTLSVLYADAALGLNNQSVRFKAKTRPADPLPLDAFAGVIDVTEFTDNCAPTLGSVSLLAAGTGPPACPGQDRVILSLRYSAAIRPDLAYVVERTSSTLEGEVEVPFDPPQVVSYDPGGDEREVGLTATRRVAVVVPVGPPRRDCFRVRMLDALGRPVGDAQNVVCIDLPADLTCPVPPVAEPTAELPGRACENHWLHTDGIYPPDAGVDGGVGGAERGGSSGCAMHGRPNGAVPLVAGLGLIALALRARRRNALNDRGSAPPR